MLASSSVIFAQQTISGIVTDQEGNPLPSVSVIIKNSEKGVSTDFDGNFSIDASEGDVLVLSSIGFESKEITVDSVSISVILSESSSELDEVVVIGYGTSLKKDLTGAVNLVKSEDFNKASFFSPQQLIQGKVAGVSIVTNSGAPGEGSNVLIRGIGSLNLNSNPLYVVDGIPLDSGGVGGMRNGLNVINPNDIESISILKDASATAIYGSRAANGVVLISTKKGRTGEFKFNFNSRTSFYTPTSFVNVLSSNEMRSVVNATGNLEWIGRLGEANTDWQREIYNNARAQDYNFSASGSLFKQPLRVSLGLTEQEGILKNDVFERTTAALNYSPSLLNSSLRLSLNARLMKTENDFADRGAIGSALFFDPTKPVYDSNSPYAGYYTWLDDDGTKLALSQTNPMALLDLRDDESIV